MGEYIGIDVYGREMYLSHACNRVYCKHVKNGKSCPNELCRGK